MTNLARLGPLGQKAPAPEPRPDYLDAVRARPAGRPPRPGRLGAALRAGYRLHRADEDRLAHLLEDSE